MKANNLFFLLILLLFSHCQRNTSNIAGQWRAILQPDSTRPDIEIPFNLDIIQSEDKAITAKITNAGEVITINEVDLVGDSIHFQLPVFEGTLQAKIVRGNMHGTYTHRASGRSWTVPFMAEQGITDRFPGYTEPPTGNITGKWEVRVGSKDQGEKQIGEFIQEGSHLTGTFLTTTGDYRFLEGKVAGNKIMLSAFDGAHALVFLANLSPEGTLENGIFSGGPSWKGEWSAFRNDTVTLPDATTLTFLRPGYDRIEFSFPDTEGSLVSLTDASYQGKPIIIQIMGSWCPNCMDETRFFTELYNDYKDKDLEIIALCYESSDPVKSAKAINRFREHTGAGYTFLHAGESNKKKASETLPMLNRVLSFPTSIFIGRDGRIEKIFTGFSGPGTGNHYAELKKEMIETVDKIIATR
jgi:thiol-disulfide isomerase/thioredoxin